MNVLSAFSLYILPHWRPAATAGTLPLISSAAFVRTTVDQMTPASTRPGECTPPRTRLGHGDVCIASTASLRLLASARTGTRRRPLRFRPLHPRCPRQMVQLVSQRPLQLSWWCRPGGDAPSAALRWSPPPAAARGAAPSFARNVCSPTPASVQRSCFVACHSTLSRLGLRPHGSRFIMPPNQVREARFLGDRRPLRGWTGVNGTRCEWCTQGHWTRVTFRSSQPHSRSTSSQLLRWRSSATLSAA